MGTKYTSVSASGYDSSPPPDDGTVSEANRGKWSTIKSKLTNVLKTFIEGVNSGLVTALDTSPRSLSASGSTASTDHWKTIEVVSASVVVTLAAASSMAAGYIVNVANQSSGNITVACQTTDTIDTVTNTTQTIPAKGCREYIVNTAATGYITKSDSAVANPTVTALTSGTGTYVTPANCKRIWVRMVGGGGGGFGSAGGGAGGTSTFAGGAVSLSASGGATGTGGGLNSPAAATSSGGDINLPGGIGQSGITTPPASNYGQPGSGGNGAFGGGGAGGASSAGPLVGLAGGTNTGAGGGGGGSAAAIAPGGGGNSGAYCEKLIGNPVALYTYAVGASGAGGVSDGTHATGGAGAAGIIIIHEYYG